MRYTNKMDFIISIILLFLLSPFFIILFICVKFFSKGSFIFRQKRMGRDKKIFIIYKIRTMVENAEELKQKIYHLNQADGPVFKIRNDPRYTKIGKFLSQTGLDELPQLINIIKGDMVFVGPRPLPVNEAKRIPKKYQERFSVLPGITSPWIVQGAHKLSFDQWMKLDLEYVKNKNILVDIGVIVKTVQLIIGLIFKKL